jgi:hypothetical protein
MRERIVNMVRYEADSLESLSVRGGLKKASGNIDRLHMKTAMHQIQKRMPQL